MMSVRTVFSAKLVRAVLPSIFYVCTMLSLMHLPIATAQEHGIKLDSQTPSVYLGDTIVIDIEAVGLLDSLDTTELLKKADLLRESYGTRISVVNGEVVEIKTRRMEFLPRREGRIVFGPLSGDTPSGQRVSNQLEFTVLPVSNIEWRPVTDDLSIHISLSDNDGNIRIMGDSTEPYEAYIGERIIVEIVLRHRHVIADEVIELPDFTDLDVLTEYEQRRTIEESEHKITTSEQSSENWRVISWRFHVFAKHSGTLHIDPIIWSGMAIRSRTQRAVFSKTSQAITLQINPAQQENHWWLPASDVSLEDSWSEDVRNLSAGDQVLRTITLSARDVLASQLPDVTPLESRALSSTLIDQKRSQTLQGEHIISSATYTFRMVAQSPIPVFLDTVRVPWYDTSSSENREAIIPARRINVGLPDRADLLAELALNEQWFDRVKLEVRSYASGFAYWHITLFVLSLIVVILLGQEILETLKQRKKNTKDVVGASELPPL